MQDINNRKLGLGGGMRGELIWEISVLSVKFCKLRLLLT